MNCNDTAEYSSIFGHCKETPRENAGRGLFVLDKRILEWQVAIFGKSTKEAERSQELKDYIKERNQSSDKRAKRIPMVPDRLVLDTEMKENVASFRNMGVLPVGMGFDTVEYNWINIRQAGSLALLGDADSRLQFTKNFLAMLARNIVRITSQIINHLRKKQLIISSRKKIKALIIRNLRNNQKIQRANHLLSNNRNRRRSPNRKKRRNQSRNQNQSHRQSLTARTGW